MPWLLRASQWRDSKGRTPLILACSRHDTVEAAKALLQLGADVNAASKGKASWAQGTGWPATGCACGWATGGH